MRRFGITLLLLFSSISCWANSSVQRIISLSPHTTELAFATGLGDKLVAVSEYSDYPARAQKLEHVANYKGIKLERILALKPDLVLAWKGGNPPREMEKLAQLGIPIFYSNPVKLEDIANNIRLLGQYADNPSQADLSATAFQNQLELLRKKYHNEKSVSYFYQLSDQPLMTVAKGGWPNQVFALCGGKNIFADSAVPYPQVNTEQVVVRQPQVIFGTSHSNTDLSRWQQWQGKIPAVDHHAIYRLNSDWLNRPTPRTLLAVQQVCDYLDQVRNSSHQ
ncbi:vitamin B12 ABC transporter substrate-binding protein BtuF [Photobacterium damselae]